MNQPEHLPEDDQLAGLIRESGTHRAPEGFNRRLMNRIALEPLPKIEVRLARARLGWAVVITVVVLLALSIAAWFLAPGSERIAALKLTSDLDSLKEWMNANPVSPVWVFGSLGLAGWLAIDVFLLRRLKRRRYS